MLIFFGGHSIKVDYVPVEKGVALIHMARAMNYPPPPPPPPENVVVVEVPDEEPDEVVAGEPSDEAITAVQARRISLERFLRKRKERWGRSSHYKTRVISFI